MADKIIAGQSSNQSIPAVTAKNIAKGTAILGESGTPTSFVDWSTEEALRRGLPRPPSDTDAAIYGKNFSDNSVGVRGYSLTGTGVEGESTSNGYGVHGKSNQQGFPGIYGENLDQGDAVFGNATGNGRGVVGVSVNHTGVEGNSQNGVGVWGSGKIAGHFEGDVEVTGDVRLNYY